MEFSPRILIIYLKHSVTCIFNGNTEEYNVKTSENDVKYSNSKAKTKNMFVSCYPTDPVLNPRPKIFTDSVTEEKRKTFDSCELTSNQVDNFKTCLSLSCRVNISKFDI